MTCVAPGQARDGEIDREANAIDREFASLRDWSARLQHLIDLGRVHVGLADHDCTQAARVHGCQSQLWLSVSAAGDVLSVRADSDAAIMRGVLALLVRLFDQRPARAVADYLRRHETVFPLLDTLAPSRSNGARLLVARLRQAAEALA